MMSSFPSFYSTMGGPVCMFVMQIDITQQNIKEYRNKKTFCNRLRIRDHLLCLICNM